MNKAQLINVIAEDAEITKAQAERALNAFTQAVTTSLSGKEDVAIMGFGTFTVSQRAARVGRNPQTGEKINIAASTIPKFKAGKGLKDGLK